VARSEGDAAPAVTRHPGGRRPNPSTPARTAPRQARPTGHRRRNARRCGSDPFSDRNGGIAPFRPRARGGAPRQGRTGTPGHRRAHPGPRNRNECNAWRISWWQQRGFYPTAAKGPPQAPRRTRRTAGCVCRYRWQIPGPGLSARASAALCTAERLDIGARGRAAHPGTAGDMEQLSTPEGLHSAAWPPAMQPLRGRWRVWAPYPSPGCAARPRAVISNRSAVKSAAGEPPPCHRPSAAPRTAPHLCLPLPGRGRTTGPVHQD
jgi:hypothetical protein